MWSTCVEGVLQHGRLPRAERGHPAVGAAAGDELERRVEQLHRAARSRRPAGRTRRRSCGRSARGRPSRCPGTRAGPRTAPRRRACAAGRRARCRPGRVGVLEQVDASCTPRVPRLTAIIGSTPARAPSCMNSSRPNALVSMAARPGRAGAAGRRAGRRRPPSGSRRRSCRPGSGPPSRRARGSGRRRRARKPCGVGGRVAGLVDAGVDAAAHVLDEGAEQAAVDRADRRRRGRRRCGRADRRASFRQLSVYNG